MGKNIALEIRGSACIILCAVPKCEGCVEIKFMSTLAPRRADSLLVGR